MNAAGIEDEISSLLLLSFHRPGHVSACIRFIPFLGVKIEEALKAG